MADFTVAAGIAQGLFEFCVARGADGHHLARESGIDPDAFENPDNRVPGSNYVALMRTGQRLCGDPAIALHFAEAVNLSRLSIVGLLVQASETLGDGLAQIRRYSRLTMDGGYERFTLVSDARGAWIVDNRPDPNDVPELTETAFAFMICGSHGHVATPFVREVHVTHSAPSYWREYERAFRAPVVFESDWNAGCIAPESFGYRIAMQPRYVFGILSKHADALLRSLEDSTTHRGRVERLLMPILHTGGAGMEAVARQMGLSRQTLFRRLKDEGVTFESVVDDLRRRLAVDYLANGRVSTADAAYLTGFSEAAAFSRAFKRWTGSTPGAARGRSPHGADRRP
jgi:AraC-like DNA-binding protein